MLVLLSVGNVKYEVREVPIGITYYFLKHITPVFLNPRAVASTIPGRERFSWNLSF